MILNMYISKLNSINYVHDNGTIDITHIQYHKIWGMNLSSCRFQATKTGGQRRNLQDQLSSGLFHPMELRTPNPPRTHSNFSAHCNSAVQVWCEVYIAQLSHANQIDSQWQGELHHVL